MDAGSQQLLARLIALGTSSLLQYASESSPWSARQSRGAFERLLTLAHEEREKATHFTRWLQKKHVRLPALGSFPSHFTTMNFVTVDHLVPKLIAEADQEIAEIERILSPLDDEEARALVQGYLDMKRRHLEALQELLLSPLFV